MANDNETVEQACEEFKTPKYTCKNCDFKICPSINAFSDRVLAAHKREMADEKRISDAVIQSLRDKKLEMAGEIAAKDAEVSALRLKREKEISDAFFCGYDPEEALVAQCSTCRFFRKKHSHCTLNDSLTNAKYKCSKWEFKTNKECADEYKKSINNEVAELREENAHLRCPLYTTTKNMV